MIVIANAIGRMSCVAIGSFADQCHNGRSVETVGYTAVALILLVFIVSKAVGGPIEH
jgi:hypothetical protein